MILAVAVEARRFRQRKLQHRRHVGAEHQTRQTTILQILPQLVGIEFDVELELAALEPSLAVSWAVSVLDRSTAAALVRASFGAQHVRAQTGLGIE